jgi:predicted Zn finger-like uncharacterized protein
MIVQCDHCSTKFKLDDAKVKPGGVKVRCSKCKEVFLVTRETHQDEADYDSLLSGLGAAGGLAAPQGEQAPEGAETPTPATEPTLSKDEQPAAFGQVFSEKPQPSTDEFDFDDQPFQTEPAAPPAGPVAGEAAPSPAEEGFDFGDVAFEPSSPGEAPIAEGAPAATDDFDFGDIPFSEEPAAGASESAATDFASESTADGFDFDEANFDVGESTVSPGTTESLPQPTGDFDFPFAADEPAVSDAATEPVPQATGDFDFQFAADEPSQELPDMEPPFPVEGVENEPGEDAFSFGDTPAQPVPEPFLDDFSDAFAVDEATVQDTATEVSQPQFDESFADAFGESAPTAGADIDLTPPAEQDQMFSFASEGGEPGASAESGKTVAEMEPLDFGDIDFGGGEEKSSESSAKGPAANWEMPAAAAAVAAAGVGAGALLSKDSSASKMPVAENPGAEEELPPLSIASRRKGSSLVQIALISLAVILVVAIGGAGFYVVQEGPSAFKKLGLDFMAGWFGMEGAAEGNIAIRNSTASFIVNKEAGELFVITGEAVNNFKKPRASIQVKVVVFGPKGAVLLQRIAYCGNMLTKEQLATLPMAKIEAAMNNQFGDSLANLGVEPGKAIPFIAVFKDLPKDAGEFGVEVAGSTVASK